MKTPASLARLLAIALCTAALTDCVYIDKVTAPVVDTQKLPGALASRPEVSGLAVTVTAPPSRPSPPQPATGQKVVARPPPIPNVKADSACTKSLSSGSDALFDYVASTGPEPITPVTKHLLVDILTKFEDVSRDDACSDQEKYTAFTNIGVIFLLEGNADQARMLFRVAHGMKVDKNWTVSLMMVMSQCTGDDQPFAALARAHLFLAHGLKERAMREQRDILDQTSCARMHDDAVILVDRPTENDLGSRFIPADAIR